MTSSSMLSVDWLTILAQVMTSMQRHPACGLQLAAGLLLAKALFPMLMFMGPVRPCSLAGVLRTLSTNLLLYRAAWSCQLWSAPLATCVTDHLKPGCAHAV